jgi:hypothetical protein
MLSNGRNVPFVCLRVAERAISVGSFSLLDSYYGKTLGFEASFFPLFVCAAIEALYPQAYHVSRM